MQSQDDAIDMEPSWGIRGWRYQRSRHVFSVKTVLLFVLPTSTLMPQRWALGPCHCRASSKLHGLRRPKIRQNVALPQDARGLSTAQWGGRQRKDTIGKGSALS